MSVWAKCRKSPVYKEITGSTPVTDSNIKVKSIPDVPLEYKDITDDAVCAIVTGAKKAMGVAKMLGNDEFEINTSEYNIIIKEKDKHDKAIN